MPSERLMQGYPPAEDSLVTVGNWQDAPANRWSFLHMREIIPTHRIARSSTPAAPWTVVDRSAELAQVAVQRLNKQVDTVGSVLDDTYTDAVLVVHDGTIVMEQYRGQMTAETPHLLMSVSKSLVGCVAANLVREGRLDPTRVVDEYIPEIAGSGYSGATVRNLLDMRTGAKFSETYNNPDAEVRAMERHMGWQPVKGQVPAGAYGYMTTLTSEGPHGGDFKYRSADSDMLGWVCERAAGRRMADMTSSYLWEPLGNHWDADVTCDRFGTAIHDGGISAVTRDLARFGQMLLADGWWNGHPVVPTEWLQAARTIDPDIRAAFAASENEPFLPGGWYRNQFWFVPGVSGTVQMCLGIHGQLVLVDRETSTVVVKYSTWPDPQNAEFLIDTIRAGTALGRHLKGLAAAGHTAAGGGSPAQNTLGGVVKA